MTAVIRNEKLRTRASDGGKITEQPYLHALLADMATYFGRNEAYRPDDIDQMFVQVTHTCIRRLKTVVMSQRYVADRHSPSVMSACWRGDTPVTLFYFEVYDHAGHRIITEEHDAELQVGYMDTLYLPYSRGLFDVVMKRVEAEIDLALEEPTLLMDAQSRQLSWREKGEYTDYMKYTRNCEKSARQNFQEAFMEVNKL